MATGSYTAEDFVFKVDDKIFKCVGTFSISYTRAKIPTTCQATGSLNTYKPGQTDVTLSGNGPIRWVTEADVANEVTAFDVARMLKAGTEVEYFFGATTIGRDGITGTMFFDSATLNGGGSEQTFDFSATSNSDTIATVAA